VNTEWKIHNPNGSRRPVGVKPDQKVHVRGGGQKLVATADRVDWRNVALWKAAVEECCAPTAEDLKLLAEGSYTPEELWGGSRPTCPKCFGK
jgi:hypothetical protein